MGEIPRASLREHITTRLDVLRPWKGYYHQPSRREKLMTGFKLIRRHARLAAKRPFLWALWQASDVDNRRRYGQATLDGVELSYRVCRYFPPFFSTSWFRPRLIARVTVFNAAASPNSIAISSWIVRCYEPIEPSEVPIDDPWGVSSDIPWVRDSLTIIAPPFRNRQRKYMTFKYRDNTMLEAGTYMTRITLARYTDSGLQWSIDTAAIRAQLIRVEDSGHALTFLVASTSALIAVASIVAAIVD